MNNTPELPNSVCFKFKTFWIEWYPVAKNNNH
jgi:hypothetical protein